MLEALAPVAASGMELVDIGFNISSKKFSSDLSDVLKRAKAAGCSDLVCTGTSLKASRDAVRLCRDQKSPESPQLWSTVGVHPHDAKTLQEGTGALEELIRKHRVSEGGPVVAVGECGLDYDRMFSTKEQQLAAFEAQLELARSLHLPVFLHERDAFDDCFRLLSGSFKDVVEQEGVVVHCFTGSKAQMEAYLGIGCHIGLTGFICKKSRGEDLRASLSALSPPLERLMIETDAPYMAPELGSPYALPMAQPPASRLRVSRNEPGATVHVCHALAGALGLSLPQVAAASTATARAFFRLPPL